MWQYTPGQLRRETFRPSPIVPFVMLGSCFEEDRFCQLARPVQTPTDSSSTETGMHARRLTYGCSEPGDTRIACLSRSFVGIL